MEILSLIFDFAPEVVLFLKFSSLNKKFREHFLSNELTSIQHTDFTTVNLKFIPNMIEKLKLNRLKSLNF